MRKCSVVGSFAALAIGLSSAARADAQQVPGFNVERLYLSPPGGGWTVMDTLDMRGATFAKLANGEDATQWGMSFQGGLSGNPLIVTTKDGTQRVDVIKTQSFFDMGLMFEFFGNSRAYVNLGFPIAIHGDSGSVSTFQYNGPSITTTDKALNDLRLGWDTRFVGKADSAFRMGAGVQFFIPLDTDRGDYSSDKTVRGMTRLLFAGDAGIITWAAHVGAQFRRDDSPFPGSPRGPELLFGAAAGPRIPLTQNAHASGFSSLVIGPEIFGASAFNSLFSTEETSLEAMLTARLEIGALKHPLGRIRFGLGTAIDQHFGAPQWRMVIGLEAVARKDDTDKDGVLDNNDACPDVPGVRTNDPKTSGCPKPPPPPDTDGDGIADDKDACRTTPGVASSDPEKNGCPAPPPNLDRDKDGIPNDKDACPAQAGPPNPDPLQNGCPVSATPPPPPPDPDRDHDNIPNDADACPDQPGPADPDPQKNGCPKAVVSGGQITINEQIEFQTGSAVIVKTSEDVLTDVAKVMTDHPEIKKVRVEGHTDNVGPAEYNRMLSQQRAASVMAWLVAHGIDKGRLTSAGLGDTKPLVPNDTEPHRQKNRRVEFHIEDPPPPTSP